MDDSQRVAPKPPPIRTRPHPLAFSAALAASCLADLQDRGLQEDCLFNGDCAAPLVCAARRCRAPCRDDRDCTNGWRCLPGAPRTCGEQACPPPARRVCVEPGGPAVCFDDRDCDGAEQVCGNDGQCRFRCLAAQHYDCQVRFGAGSRCEDRGDGMSVCAAPTGDAGADAGADVAEGG